MTNRYVKFRTEVSRMGVGTVNKKCPYTRDELNALARAGTPVDMSQYGIKKVMKLPGINRKPNTKVRSDKGKAHRKKTQDKKQDLVAKYGFMPEKTYLPDSRDTLWRELKAQEEWNKKYDERKERNAKRKARADLPHRIERRRKEHTEYCRNRSAETNAKRRETRGLNGRADAEKRKANRLAELPPDRICILCNEEKLALKQWRRLLFADGNNNICRRCYEHVRIKLFNKDVKLALAFFKCCKYGDLNKELRLK